VYKKRREEKGRKEGRKAQGKGDGVELWRPSKKQWTPENLFSREGEHKETRSPLTNQPTNQPINQQLHNNNLLTETISLNQNSLIIN
jgi:hypothetical protein